MPPRTRPPQPVTCDCGYGHVHGTRRMYTVHKCGCFPCRVAHASTETAWRNGGTTAEGRYMDAAGTRRRIEGLGALGWTHVQIGQLLGCSKENVVCLRIAERVHVSTAERVRQAANGLAGQLPPTGWLADRTRRESRGKGWLSLFAWDDDTIDDPTYQPALPEPDVALDEVAVQRIIDGTLRIGRNSRSLERIEAIRRLAAAGNEDAVIGQRIGMARDAVQRARLRAGIPAGVASTRKKAA